MTERSGQTIMIVEDSAEIRESLAWLLRRDGRVVVEAPDGLEALERLRWGLRPALILLDMRMAVMTGWEFRAEQKRSPDFAGIPVVAMTSGQWKPQDLEDFSARIAKPINLDELLTIVNRFCGPPPNAAPAPEAGEPPAVDR